jgi:hypothetical protein
VTEFSDTELEELAEIAATHLDDICDLARQNIYNALKASGAPEAEIEAARLELDASVNAMVEAKIAELLGKKETRH